MKETIAGAFSCRQDDYEAVGQEEGVLPPRHQDGGPEFCPFETSKPSQPLANRFWRCRSHTLERSPLRDR